MIIKRKFNNNVILSEDDKGIEVVLIGKGISFEKKIGDEIDQSQIEKKFVLDNGDTHSNFETLLNEIPPQQIFLVTKIIELAEKELNATFSNSLFIGLVDHLNYALERYRNGMTIKNVMLWEIKRFYPDEFNCAKKAIEMVHYYENIWLNDDEAGYIALHFVNAKQGSEIKETLLITEIVKHVIQIIKFHFNINLDENSMSYLRLVTHIRYFTLRSLKHEVTHDITQGELFNVLKNSYPDVWKCVLKIGEYLSKTLDVQFGEDEYTFLMVHVIRVVRK